MQARYVFGVACICLVAGQVLGRDPVWSYYDPNYGQAVGDEEVPSGCRPVAPSTLMPGYCNRMYRCYRQDGLNPRVINWGVPVRIDGSELYCNFCSQCCQDVPYMNHCVQQLCVTDNRSFTFQFGAGIRAGIPRIRSILEGYAEGHFGYEWQTGRTWCVQGGSNAMPPCTRGRWRVWAEVYRGRVFAVDSRYHWVLHYSGAPECKVDYDAGWCDVVRTSTLTSTWWAYVYVESVYVPPCGGS